MRHALHSLFFTLYAAGTVAPTAAFADSYPFPPAGTDVIGAIQTVTARYEDTLLDIARRNGLGYEEIKLANPGVDTWLPGAGTVVILPKRYILPATPREGIVLNAPEMRIYYYPKAVKNRARQVVTYPVSIGRDDWRTPLVSTRVVAKNKDPAWSPPESIRREHAAEGDPLPKIVPPGPDNPLGGFALRLGIDGYLIHGTNKPNGLGMRVTHGCMRLYPEDIESLFHQVPVNTPVRIVNAPYKVGRINGVPYLEIHPPLQEDADLHRNTLTPLVKVLTAAFGDQRVAVNWAQARELVADPTGMPVAIRPNNARVVPSNTWD